MFKATRKFKILLVMTLAMIIALVCGIVVLSVDVLRIKAELDRLHWIAENTHSGGVRIAIEVAEAKLHEQLTILTVLIVVTTVVLMMGLFAGLRQKLKER